MYKILTVLECERVVLGLVLLHRVCMTVLEICTELAFDRFPCYRRKQMIKSTLDVTVLFLSLRGTAQIDKYRRVPIGDYGELLGDCKMQQMA